MLTTPFPSDEDRAAWVAAILDSSDDAIVSKTLDGLITSWNRAAERIFGWTAAEAVGRSITIVIPPERLAEEEDILARIHRGEKIEYFETTRIRKDGTRFEISLTVSPIKNAKGEVIGASKIARDISERRHGDEARARLAAIVDSADDAIVSKTLDGVITSWNRAAERIFGWTAAEAVGQRITLIIPRERWPEEDEVLARVRKGESIDHFDTVRVRKNGERIDVSLTVSPVKDARGRIIGASKIARDVSERKRAEAERTKLLQTVQQAREEAEELNRSKDQFLAMLSHELRTPLNAIFGWARMLQSAAMDEATSRRAIDAILRNATAQVQLVEDLLDVSRIITGKMRLDVQSLDLKSVIESALDAVQPAAAAKGLKIETVLDPNAGPVVGAADRLRQVVWNLLMNAIKFTPRDGRVQVHLRKVKSHVEIVVSDNGEGIQPEILPFIFDRFRQGDSTTTRPHGGLGLGLALVRHLVDLHGGRVRAASEGPGRGATFVVELPVAILGSEAGTTLEASAATGALPLQNVRVLLVDDDADGLDLTTVMLTNSGAQVKTAVSVAAALNVLESWPADVLVSDIEMPGEDGYELLRRIRAKERGGRTRLPALALTAYGRPEDRRRTLAAGFNLHLAKPIDPSELVLAVANLVGRTG
jgi:PAS domain S-box-containing protein